MVQTLFIEAMSAALRKEKVAWNQEITTGQWSELFALAQVHRVLPMIFDAVSACPAAKAADRTLFLSTKRTVYQQVMAQVAKTEEFTGLYRHLRRQGLRPVLVKGLVCRELYPNPDYRTSGDEDLLIHPEAFPACHQAMLDYGMYVSSAEADLQTDFEVPYRKAGSLLYIELHKSLFPPESRAYGDLNRFFSPEQIKTVSINANGAELITLEPGSHLFYLICHAYKHFLHSGFGVRQLCDIGLFAQKYAGEIDWQEVRDRCAAIHAVHFAAGILKIAQVHFSISMDTGAFPEEWRNSGIDETALLEDILAGGVYGQSTQSRMHSSNMTLDAVADAQSGAGRKSGLKNSLFPSRHKLEKRYPYLKKYPVLLPVAWTSRIASYIKETGHADNSAADALKIGKNRIQLLKQYRIIEE